MLIGTSMRLHAPELEVVNFATYRATVAPAEPLTAPLGLSFEHEPQGMWDMERYVSLLMGEVPRLTDDAAGYGPHSRGSADGIHPAQRAVSPSHPRGKSCVCVVARININLY